MTITVIAYPERQVEFIGIRAFFWRNATVSSHFPMKSALHE
jgi:hypothetical protein